MCARIYPKIIKYKAMNDTVISSMVINEVTIAGGVMHLLLKFYSSQNYLRGFTHIIFECILEHFRSGAHIGLIAANQKLMHHVIKRLPLSCHFTFLNYIYF